MSGLSLSNSQVLAIIFPVVFSFFLLTAGVFLYFKKKQFDENYVPLTETEARFFEIYKLRRAIHDSEKKIKKGSIRNEEWKQERKNLEKLKQDLEDLKEKQTEEFLSLL